MILEKNSTNNYFDTKKNIISLFCCNQMYPKFKQDEKTIKIYFTAA